MGRKVNNTADQTAAQEPNYIEFDLDQGANTASGRAFITSATSTEKTNIIPLSLNINGLCIKGASLFVSRSGSYDPFIKFPSYKNKKGEDVSYIFMVEKDDIAFLKELSKTISGLL